MKKNQRIVLLATAALLPEAARAQLVISDTLTGASSSYNWQALNGACLTAGNNTGSIPACSGLSYYSGKKLVGGANGALPDAVGQGALRLTNGDTVSNGSNGNNQNGAVVSNFTFPTNQGVQVTFTTVTYGGNGYSNNANQSSGADGISFFLSDGSQPATVGGLGGSLGYSCSNQTRTTTDSNGNTIYIGYNGVQGGYIGVGIDEYGNFSNKGDNTNSGPAQNAGRISLRGSGNTTLAFLQSVAPKTYGSVKDGSQQASNAITAACKAGTYKDDNGNTVALPYNYNYTTYSTLPNNVTLFSQEGAGTVKGGASAAVRGGATPITYAINITQDGKMSMSYSVNGGAAQSVMSNQSITSTNGPLPSSFRFGFSAGTGSGSNVHEITCFKAAPVNQSSSSAGTNVQQSARVQAGTQVYLAYYHPTNWWGELTAQNLVMDPTTGIVSIATNANWNASCTLTGGACPAISSTSTVTAQAPSARSILTWNGVSGIPFQWTSLTSAQKSALDSGSANSGSSPRQLFLRGDRTYEVANGGSFRTRNGVLGDIMNSSPTWVGAPSAPYNGPWVDARYPTATPVEPAGSYALFKTNNATRANVVYVGANDGMLHGFRAGGYDTNGNFTTATTPNDGQEVLAYMPAAALNTIYNSTNANLDFSSTSYAHNLFVDATPGTGELYYGGAWHTWLVGGLGGGGNAGGIIGDNATAGTGAIYALDITNPANFSEGNAGSLVVGEWSPSNLKCANYTPNTNCSAYLGNTYGTPVIRRLHNGNWAVLFGNGLNSPNGGAGLYVMLVASDGTTSFYYLDTGYGPSKDPLGKSNKNGIAYVTPADLDGDHITDYVYAGDAFGNVWRFDLTSQNPAQWNVSTTPLFSTPAGQPITSKVAVAAIPGTGTGAPRVLVSFGTGQAFPQTQTNAAAYANSTSQWLYGVWDWDMSTWNSKAPASAAYATLTGSQTVNASTLLTQTITATSISSGTTPSYRTVSNGKVCWVGSTACGSAANANTQYGWKLMLPSTTTGSGTSAVTNYEQVVYNPTLAYGMFIVNTTVPGTQQILSCTSTPASGYTMAISVASGGAGTQSFFGDNNNNFPTYNGGIVSGIGLSGTGTPSLVTANKLPYLVQQTVSGTGTVNQINPSAAGVGSRLNWTKLR
ncbi:pilus assembly protein [Ralstonia insidiosa]|uniref:pilus assembly protein n=1 Tax=Ralstonia insidiosa TaxID=190721 RepID=UPI000CEEBF1E|nr:PilC/PilY family type IV pilus protein [Ralstonia insidiosa]